MTSATLAARIAALSAHLGNLEELHALSPAVSWATMERRNALAFEIAGLHALVDLLNQDYEETRAREMDVSFEAVGR